MTSTIQDETKSGFDIMRQMETEHEKDNPAYFLQVLHSQTRMVLRLHAVCALADVGDESAVPALAQILLTEHDALLRHEAAFSLGQMGLKSGIPALIEAMLHDSSEIVRHEAAAALGSIGDQSARRALQQALSDPSELVTGSAKASLYNLDFLRHQTTIRADPSRNTIRP